MQLHISGRQVDLGAAFQAHVEKRLSEGLNKYLDRIVSVDVVVSKEAHHQFRVISAALKIITSKIRPNCAPSAPVNMC